MPLFTNHGYMGLRPPQQFYYSGSQIHWVWLRNRQSWWSYNFQWKFNGSCCLWLRSRWIWPAGSSWDLVRYVEISLIERISPHLVKKPTYRLKWRSLTVVISPTGWSRIFLQRLALNSCLSNFLSKDLSLTATLVEFWFRSLQIGQFFWVGSRLDTPIKWFICICNYWFYHLGDKILWSQIKV